MLKLNLSKIFQIRNIHNPAGFLKTAGLNYYSGRNYLSGAQRVVSINVIERLCTELYCTPNDLFEWSSEKEMPGHPLNQLKNRDVAELAKKLHQLPIEKLDEFKTWLDQQK